MLHRLPYDPSHQAAMIALAQTDPEAHVHAIDLPWRLSSWALDDQANIGLWVDPQATLYAWAVMQAPFWTIDYAFHSAADSALRSEVWAWADERARELAGTVCGRPSWYASVFAQQTALHEELEAAGFISQTDLPVDAWSEVLLTRSTQTPLPAGSLPPGYTLRPLAGEGEVAAYVKLHRAVFESRSMTEPWRARTLQCPEHNEDLDLVIEAPDGHLAAFCVGWLASGGNIGQIEPLGVAKEHRGVGLGRTILAEAVRRLHARGAGQVIVVTDNYREAALGLYAAVGFRMSMEILMCRKDFETT